jgi:hypothetical protein
LVTPLCGLRREFGLRNQFYRFYAPLKKPLKRFFMRTCFSLG